MLTRSNSFRIDKRTGFYYERARLTNGRRDAMRRSNVETRNVSGCQASRGPYRPLREDPRYDEIKKLIESFPPENMDKLKLYISRWLRGQ